MSEKATRVAYGEALAELYSPAQLRVLGRCHELLAAD